MSERTFGIIVLPMLRGVLISKYRKAIKKGIQK